MNQSQHKVIGILGGMGPEATMDLFKKIVNLTPASRDQDHIRVIIDNNPQIPDRQEAILGDGPSPAPLLVETARNLEMAGAGFIVMPCNTAHYWIEEIRSAVGIPVIDMIDVTAEEIAKRYPSLRVVGLLAATGTVRSGLYQKRLSSAGVRVVSPAESDQAALMRVIYAVKSGDSSESSAVAIAIGQRLVAAGAKAAIAGCTEIPLILRVGDLSIPIVDATKVLAKRAVGIALGSLEL